MSIFYRLVYYDRRERRVKSDAVPAARLTHWIFNTTVGRAAGAVVFGTSAVSRLSGRLQKSRWSRRRIRPFMEKYGIDPADLARPPEAYASFFDFFVRDIDPARRPFSPDPEVVAAPVDGRVLVYDDIPLDREFPIKSAVFNLRTFLQNDRLAAEFADGILIVSRLALGDYHYVHFPFSGIPGTPVSIPGAYYPSGPYARGRRIPIFRANHRMITEVETDRFGRALIVEIGAFTVGSIRQLFRPGRAAAKGDKKARFEPGGSTIALVFKKGAIALEADLLARTPSGMETYVRLGEPLGGAPAGSRPKPAP